MTYDFDIVILVPNELLAEFLRDELSSVFPELTVEVDEDIGRASCQVSEYAADDLDAFFEILYADYIHVIDDMTYDADISGDVRVQLTENSLSSDGRRHLAQMRKRRRIERKHQRSREKKARAKARRQDS